MNDEEEITFEMLEKKQQQIRKKILKTSELIKKQQITSEETTEEIKLLVQKQQELNRQMNLNFRKNEKETNNTLEQLFNQSHRQCHGPCKKIFYNPDSLILIAYVKDISSDGKMEIDHYWLCHACFQQSHNNYQNFIGK